MEMKKNLKPDEASNLDELNEELVEEIFNMPDEADSSDDEHDHHEQASFGLR